MSDGTQQWKFGYFEITKKINDTRWKIKKMVR